MKYFLLNKNTFLNIKYVKGDNVGGDGSCPNGGFNNKYKSYYIFKFLYKNPIVKYLASSIESGLTLYNSLIEQNIVKKYNNLFDMLQSDETAFFGGESEIDYYKRKYIKYKIKYLAL